MPKILFEECFPLPLFLTGIRWEGNRKACKTGKGEELIWKGETDRVVGYFSLQPIAERGQGNLRRIKFG